MSTFRAAALGACAAIAAVATAATLEREQFEVGWPLELPQGESQAQTIFDVPLTAEVYAHAPSVDQLAVLDGVGNTMPFYRVGAAPAAATEQRFALGASPLYANDAGGGLAELSVRAGAGETSIVVTPSPADSAREAVAFAVDARGVEARPIALELDWRAQPQPFLLDVRVEQSRTLTDWRTVGRGSVAQLRIGDSDVFHKRVPVSADAGGYFRITWGSEVPAWYLERVTLVSATAERAALELATAAPVPESASPKPERGVENALYFDAGGTLPVSSVTLDFAGGNGWTHAAVAAASSLDGPWTTLARGRLFYEIDYEGRSFASEPLEVGRREARYWRIATPEPLAPERVTMKLQYPAERLRVSAAGTAPYWLVAGTVAREAGPDPTFEAVWRALPAPAAPPARASLGALRELGGAAALEAPYVFPWRVAVLWAVLGAGVLAVGLMAVRLARELGKPQS